MSTPEKSHLGRYSLEELITEREITVRDLRDIEAEIKSRPPSEGGPPRENLPARILACLRQNGDLSPAMIASLVDGDRGAVGCALVRMKKAGRIARRGVGMYYAPGVISTVSKSA